MNWNCKTMGISRRMVILFAICFNGFAGFYAASIASAQDQKLTPVTLRTDVFFYGSHVPLLVGIVDGIYKKHGLEVTAMTGRGSATTLQTVANLSDHFGFADGGTHVRLAAQGLKAKQIVGMLQGNPMTIFAFPDSGIKSPKDLNGKTGGFTPGSSPEMVFPAFAKKTGIDIDSIKKVSVDIPTRDSIFILRKTDFSFGYTVTQAPILEERCGCTLVKMKYLDYGITALSNGIVVSDELIAKNPGLVRAFARATQEAIEVAVKNPERAVDMFFKYAKDTQLSRNVVTNQWQETIRILHTKATEDKPYGIMAESDWQKTIELLVEYAGVPKGSVTPNLVFTNEFLQR